MTKDPYIPPPDDVWGIELLGPVQQSEWVQERWQQMLDDTDEKPLLLSYTHSAERAALRCLQTFTRLGRQEKLEVLLIAPDKFPLLSRPSNSQQVYLVHRTSRFCNVEKWLRIRTRYSPARCVFTVPANELGNVPSLEQFRLAEVPHVDDWVARKRASEIITKRIGDLHQLRNSLLFQLLVEIGQAGVEIQFGLLQRALRLSELQLLDNLCEPEICDLIRISGPGPLQKNYISFRGTWLAKHIAEIAGFADHMIMESIIKRIQPAQRDDRQFFLSYLIAVQAQGFHVQLDHIRGKWNDKISACSDAAGEPTNMAWAAFCDDGRWSALRMFFFADKTVPRKKTGKRLLDLFDL